MSTATASSDAQDAGETSSPPTPSSTAVPAGQASGSRSPAPSARASTAAWLMVRTEDALRGMRRTSGPRIRGWTAADRAAILHQRRRADLRGEAVTTQRSILMLSIGLALVYVWLRGGFIGLTAAPAAAAQLPTMQPGWEKATFAMGCFWSAEVRLRQAQWREIHDVGLHRRPRVEPELRAGVARVHRSRRSDRGRASIPPW